MSKTIVYYSDKSGIVVTDRFFRTRLKDQALAPISSVRIGRDALYVCGAIGLGIATFACSVGDLLFLHEQVCLAVLALALTAVGYSFATLEVGSYMRQERVAWGFYWKIKTIRDAVIDARGSLPDSVEISTSVEPS